MGDAEIALWQWRELVPRGGSLRAAGAGWERGAWALRACLPQSRVAPYGGTSPSRRAKEAAS